MLDFIVRWSEKAKSLLRANIIWNSSVHLQEQMRMYQVSWDLYPPPYYLEAESVVGYGLNWIHAYLHTVHGYIRIFTPSTHFRRGCSELTFSFHQETVPHMFFIH